METRPYARRNAAGRIQYEPATWNNFTLTRTHSELVDHFLRAGCPPDQARQNTDREFRTPVTRPGTDAPIPAEYSEDGRAQRENSRGRASSPPRRAQGRGATPFDLFRGPENFPSQDPDGYVRPAEELDWYRRWYADLSHQEHPGEPRRVIERLVGVMNVEESARRSRDSLPIDWRNVLFQYLWQRTNCTEEEVQKLIDQAVRFELEARNGRPSQHARPPRGYAPRRYQPPTRAQVQDADSAEVFSAILGLVFRTWILQVRQASGMSVERAEIALDGEFFAAKERHPHLSEFSWFKEILANDCIRLCGAGSLQQAHEIIEGKVVRMRREFFTDGVITATRWFDL